MAVENSLKSNVSETLVDQSEKKMLQAYFLMSHEFWGPGVIFEYSGLAIL